MRNTLIAIIVAGLLPALALTAAPVIYITGLLDSTKGDTSGMPVNTITAGQPQTYYFKVKDSGGYDQINLVRIVMWDYDVVTLASNNSAQYKAEYIYYPALKSWLLRPGSPDWDLVETYNSAPAATNTGTNWMRFVLVFKAGNQAKVERYFPRWTIRVTASNQSGGVTSYPTNFYLKLSETTARVAGSSLRGDHNPFTISQDETMAFVYQASADTGVTLKIYTIYGELVKTLFDDKPVQNGIVYDGTKDPDWEWDGKNGASKEVASGIYTAILTTKDGSQQALVYNFVVYK